MTWLYGELHTPDETRLRAQRFVCHACKHGEHVKCTLNLRLNHGQKGICKCRVCAKMKKAALDAISTQSVASL